MTNYIWSFISFFPELTLLLVIGVNVCFSQPPIYQLGKKRRSWWSIAHLDDMCNYHWLFVLIISIIPTETRVQQRTTFLMALMVVVVVALPITPPQPPSPPLSFKLSEMMTMITRRMLIINIIQLNDTALRRTPVLPSKNRGDPWSEGENISISSIQLLLTSRLEHKIAKVSLLKYQTSAW